MSKPRTGWGRWDPPEDEPLLAWLLGLFPPLARRLRRPALQEIADLVHKELRELPSALDTELSTPQILLVLEQLASLAVESREQSTEAARRFDDFSSLYSRAADDWARARIAAEHLRATVDSPRELRRDLKALKRWLDLEALRERHARWIATQALRLELILQSIQRGAERLEREPEQFGGGVEGLHRFLVDYLGMVPFLLRLSHERGQWKTRVSALKMLIFLSERALKLKKGLPLEPGALREVIAAAQDVHEYVHTQRDATRLLLLLDQDAGVAVLHRRLLQRPLPEHPDDFLYRAAALGLVVRHFPAERALQTLTEIVEIGDPSEYVRMKVVEVVPQLGGAAARSLLTRLSLGGDLDDASHRVRARVIEAWLQVFELAMENLALTPGHAPSHGASMQAAEGLAASLGLERHIVPLRVAIEECERMLLRLAELPSEEGAIRLEDRVRSILLPKLADLAAGETSRVPPLVSLEAARLLGKLRLSRDEEEAELVEHIEQCFEASIPGATRRLDPGHYSDEQWCQALAKAGQDDFGFYARRAGGDVLVTRGELPRRALWRILHEARERGPTKRQGKLHTTAPRAAGTLRAPPLGLAAITPTTVPGEPYVSPILGSWAPFLPSVADLLDSARLNREVVIAHPFGTTRVKPPSGWDRVRTIWKLRLGFTDFDAARGRALSTTEAMERAAFVNSARDLGFSVELTPTEVDTGERERSLRSRLVNSFFRGGAAPQLAFLGVADLPRLAEQAANYALSTGGNTLAHLGALLVGLWAVLLGDAGLQARRIDAWRDKVPLVVGGWGTRGKSGTERLKAALFHGLGYEIVSKTTGCEAMIIHSAPGLEPREIFLYRPYDKASIWEQRDVLRIAAQMGSQVMLWECMALNPRYVEILQLEWMRDDISTITNCYPDHEDVQGPAGRDVAETISRFVPRRSRLITSEREMLPIVRERAKLLDTPCDVVTDRDAAMISEDLLDRFPYQEHPRNIALVTRMAKTLGIGAEFSILAMAEHVVPDLGSLTVFPDAHHRGRTISYINGHSANERTGFLNNWQSTGMASFDAEQHPGEWIGGVVNNRGDRIPRSQVFARILAGDVSAHVLVLIGSNLGGFRSYLQEALREQIADLDLGDDKDTALARFGHLARRLQMPRWDIGFFAATVGSWLQGCGVEALAVEQRFERAGVQAAMEGFLRSQDFDQSDGYFRRVLQAALQDSSLKEALTDWIGEPCGDERDADLLRFAQRQVAICAALAACEWALTQADDPRRWSRSIGDLFVEMVLERTHSLQDADAKGDQVLDFLASKLPPGVRARIMGMQNIKGTGLDFVYRWVSYEQVHKQVALLAGRDPRTLRNALRWLRGHTDYGILDTQLALNAVIALIEDGLEDQEEIAQDAHHLKIWLGVLTKRKRAALTSTTQRPSTWDALIKIAERALDYLHSVYRRRRADRVYADLVTGRVSHARAALLMRELTASQKGGWLKALLKRD